MPPRHPRRPIDPRRGVTLLELLVVLLLIGLAATLAVPALVRPAAADATGDTIAGVVQRARATAIRRGETLALDVEPDGRWSLRVAHADSLPIGDGAAPPDPAMPRRLLVTPLGLCLPDDGGDGAATGGAVASGAVWDAAACRAGARLLSGR